MVNCEFSNPVNWLGTPPIEYEMWNFKNATCDFDTYQLIENATTGAEFYINKKIDYGDVLIVFLILLFLIFGISKSIAKFVFKRYV